MVLRRWRERALLTQEELAERSGLSVRTIRRMEGGSLPRVRSTSLRLVGEALELNEEERAILAADQAADQSADQGTDRGVAPPEAGAAPQPGGCGTSWGGWAAGCRWPGFVPHDPGVAAGRVAVDGDD
ncbi:helix-turn-helix transcriptional regulator [Streptosporangium sp. NPDC002524]|uniref:helix-turn-helix domain-containing protein n=1 Tax=Streptosporangium sp. NPDC002524 TaxID=3154537 RepID=UPI00332A3ECD